MATVSLLAFLQTGMLGSVRLGIDASALETSFGPPEAKGGTSRRHRKPAIWAYGDVEFHFDRPTCTLSLIHIDRFTGPDGSPTGWGHLALDPWVVREAVPIDVIQTASASIDLRPTLRRHPGLDQDWLVFPSGVIVSFVTSGDHSGPGGLCSLSYGATQQVSAPKHVRS